MALSIKGTDDSGATDSDPTGGGATGNNMVKVWSGDYDENNNLIEEKRPVDGTSTNDRVVEYTFDYRNRLDESETSDGEGNTYLSKNTYNDMNLVTQVDRYHTSVLAGNLTGRVKNYFDLRARTYKSETYSVATNGTVGDAIAAENWFDPLSRPIKQVAAGQTAATKTEFDGVGRTTATYLVVQGDNEPSPGDVSDDIVIEQSEPTYDDASNVIATETKLRFHSSTGTGSLGGPSGSQPRARAMYAATYPDGIGRPVTTANYGTNGGSSFARPAVAPAASDTILVSSVSYDVDTGELVESTATDGVVDKIEFDDAGRTTKTIENFVQSGTGDDENRTAEYTYTSGSKLKTLKLINADTGDQTTTWTYGTTLTDSEVASNELLVSKEYPEGDKDEFTYNRQGNVNTSEDGNGTVHTFEYDKLGRGIHDRATTLGAGIDGSVRRKSFAFDNRGQLSTATTYDNATVGSGSVVNQVEREYSGLGCLITDKQEHSGTVDGSTPEVAYTCTNGSGGVQRLTSMVYPNGRQIDYGYGSAGSIDDALNRVATVVDDGTLTTLAEMQYAGAGLMSELDYPVPDAVLSMEGTAGDGGDILAGYDRFNRIIGINWKKSTTVLYECEYGYDRASRRLWLDDLTSASGGTHDRLYGYDDLSQVTSADVGTLNTNKDGMTGTPAREETFGFDPWGNWNNYDQDLNGSSDITQIRVHNKDNQITEIDSSSTVVALR